MSSLFAGVSYTLGCIVSRVSEVLFFLDFSSTPVDRSGVGGDWPRP